MSEVVVVAVAVGVAVVKLEEQSATTAAKETLRQREGLKEA